MSHSIKLEEDCEVGIGKDVVGNQCDQFKNTTAQICFQKLNLLRKECTDYSHM